MKVESILLFKEQDFECKGWLIHIRKKPSFLKNKFSVLISAHTNAIARSNAYNPGIEKTEIRKEITTKMSIRDWLGNNKKMYEECMKQIKQYIDSSLGDANRYIQDHGTPFTKNPPE